MRSHQPRSRPRPGTDLDRREFIRLGAAAAAGLAIGRPAWSATLPYQVTGWHGDAFENGHKVRDDGFARRPAPSRKYDVVVVGGGIAGMTAAFKLRDLDLLVLEQDRQVGGMAKALKSGEHELNLGAAYFTGATGELGQLWRELGLDLKPVALPNDRWRRQGSWIASPWEEETIARIDPALGKPMAAVRRAIADILRGKDFPENPYTNASAEALKLDTISFATWLAPYATPELMRYINGYCYSALGASADALSAYGGINFYSEFFDDIYAFPEGNAHLIKVMTAAVAAAGQGRIQSGCTVYRVEPVDDGLSRVYYARGEESVCVEARRVVVATPYFVTSRILAGISDGQRYALNLPKYAAYLVAGLVFDRVVSLDAYDSWVPDARGFDDFIPTTWVDRDLQATLSSKNAGQSLTCFACERRPGVGRWRMMTREPRDLAPRIVDAFEQAVPGSTAHLREVHMARWGHAMIINQPGMYTRWLPKLRKRHGGVLLAHSDGQGLPAVESSAHEAIVAAEQIRAHWKT